MSATTTTNPWPAEHDARADEARCSHERGGHPSDTWAAALHDPETGSWEFRVVTRASTDLLAAFPQIWDISHGKCEKWK